jgi:hypothetical protein
MSNNQQILNDVASDLYTTLSLNEDLKSKIILLPKSENSSEFVLEFINHDKTNSFIKGMFISVPYEYDNIWELRFGNIPEVIKISLIGEFKGFLHKSYIIADRSIGYENGFLLFSKKEIYLEINRIYNYIIN